MRRRWKLKHRREPLSEAGRAYLLLGLGGVMAAHKRAPLDGYEYAVYFRGRHALPAVWGEHQEELLADWIHEQPGTRPWAWWRFDAAAPRACLEGAAYVYSRGADWHWREHFGVPSHPVVRRPGAAPTHMVFESQPAYLQRLDLFLPGEAERINAEDFEPETITIPEDPILDQLALRPGGPAA